MQQNASIWWFWLGTCVSCGVACTVLLLSWLYGQWCKPKRVTRSVTDWQTAPLPEPELEMMDFQAFYVLLSQYGRYTRIQAKRFYALAMYETAAKEESPEQPELPITYDIDLELELILKALEEKGA